MGGAASPKEHEEPAVQLQGVSGGSAVGYHGVHVAEPVQTVRTCNRRLARKGKEPWQEPTKW